MQLEEFEGRLMIHKVVLENFKSYAGVKEIGPFHKNFTSVVGPNGSGKSNLLECLLFAFGKRARKMRLKKISDLIHKSQRHPNLSFARVSVYFQNILDKGDEFEVVSGSELVLTRTVHKNNTSTYKLDSRESSFEEVTATLKKRGVDLEQNRFLILQGEVEQIAMMKPKAPPNEENKVGLMEYLEEIIGTNKYVPLINDAEADLEAFGEDISAKKTRLEEAEKALEELEGPKNQALAYIDLEKEHYQLLNIKHQISAHNFYREETKLGEEIVEVKKNLKQIETEYKEKQEEHKEVIEEHKGLSEKLKKDSLELEEVKSQIEQTSKKHLEVQETIKRSSKKLEKIKGDKKRELNRINTIDKTFSEFTEEIPQKHQRLSEIKGELKTTETRYEQLSSEALTKTKNLQKEKNSIKEKLNPYQDQLNENQKNIDYSAKRIQDLQNELEQTHSDKNKILQEIQNSSTEIQNNQEYLSKTEQAISQKQTQIQEAKNRCSEVRKQLQEVSNALEQERGVLAEAENTEKAQEAENRVLREVMAASRTGELQGVIGRLGDLGSVDSKYDIAVSSSAGGRLDYIVVETANQATELIEFIRSKQLGRVNLIALDKIQQNFSEKSNARFNCPDNRCQRLFDLIDVKNPRLKVAFYFAFADTLVANDIETARQIAFGGRKRWRVVTLSGEIINVSGEMQGFSKPLKGKMVLNNQKRASLNPQDLYNLHQAIDELAQKERYLLQELKELQTFQSVEIRNLDDLKNTLKRIGTTIKDLEEKKTNLSVRLGQIENSNSENIKQEIKELQATVEGLNAMKPKIQSLIEKESNKIQEIQKQIDEIAGEEFKELRLKRESLRKEQETTENELMKMQKQLENYETDKQKSKLNLEKLQKEKLEETNYIEELKTTKERLEEEGEVKAQTMGSLIEEIENLQERKKQLTDKEIATKEVFDEIMQKRVSLKQNKSKIQEKQKEAQKEYSKCFKVIEKNREKYNQIQSEYNELMGNMMEIEEEPQEEEATQPITKKKKKETERQNLRYQVNKDFTPEELLELEPKAQVIETMIQEVRSELEEAKPNLKIISDYREKKQDKDEKAQMLEDSREAEIEKRKLYNELKSKRLHEFTVGFTLISQKLKEMYRMITRGGDAELEFADSTDPFAEGIIFTVRPPSKSWKKMANLSGGEKTLSSLALVFALHHYKPNALYVMDEVDAALDFQNVSVIANYIKSRTKDAQFVIVSLRYQMFELADRLVGVYKTEDVSHSIAISPCLLESTSPNPIIRQTVNNITVPN